MRKKLLTNGSAFKRTDDYWGGTVWFMNEKGERKRKSFSGTTKQEVNKKDVRLHHSVQSGVAQIRQVEKDTSGKYAELVEVFKFPSVERLTYDRCECTAKHQAYPVLGDKIVSDITAADIKDFLNQKMQEGYAYTTVKKAYVILGEYFRDLT